LYLAGINIKGYIMVLIFLPAITNRARYIFRLYFDDLIGLEFSLTSSADEFQSYTGPKINYSNKNFGKEIFINADTFLFERDISMPHFRLSEYNGIPAFFGQPDVNASLPFDPFAAGFYMVSRFEEYLLFKGDRFGRFRSEDSIAFQGKFINKPVVNLWANMIRDLLVSEYPDLRPKEKKFRFIPTIDIDHAYAFGHRKLSRIIGGFSRDISNGKFSNVLLRTRVMFKKEKDPYDNYDVILQMHRSYNLKPLFFILFAEYGNNDNNVSLHNKEFRALIRRLDKEAEVGIHPSLASNRRFSLLDKEIYRLCDLLDRQVIRSRQHFLKISLPRTYRNLLKCGILHDYSMGYATVPGFRAGIADPFRFFDLVESKETGLVIHPVTVMDVSLRDYQGLDPRKSLDEILSIMNTVRSVNGEFISLWHNESFSETGRWKGWRAAYEEMLKHASG
jgi:hypothetical protein